MSRLSEALGHADTIEEVVGLAVGAGSMCWVDGNGNRVFDSTEASSVVDAAVARLKEMAIGR